MSEPSEATQAVNSPGPTETFAVQPFAPDGRRPVRMRTVVVGVVMLAIALVALLNLTTSIHLDPGGVALTLLIVCGVLLIAGARRE